MVVDKSKSLVDKVKGMSPQQKKKAAAAVGVGVFAGVGWFGVANSGAAPAAGAGKKK